MEEVPHKERRERRYEEEPYNECLSSNIKCFKCLSKGHIALRCPNNRSMIMKEDRIVDSACSISKSSSKSQYDAYEYSLNEEGDLLVVARLLEKLKPPTLAYPESYKLQWLNNEGEIVVLCDMVPIEVAHILLGRPWQYDHKVIHDRVTNRFTFVPRGHKVILKPLSLKEVNEDQAKMKLWREKKKKKREKKSEKQMKDDLLPRMKYVQRELCLQRTLSVQNKKKMKKKCERKGGILSDFPTSLTKMLESFQGLFLEEIPRGLPPIRGIEHQIDFTIYLMRVKTTKNELIKKLIEKG
ncbi:hypothetical protein CR513_07624, partial [Mucuna pruriens]